MIAKLPRDSQDFVSPLKVQQKIEEIIEAVNNLADAMPCSFVDGMCKVHNSPQIYIGKYNVPDHYGELMGKQPTDYCAVAEQKMRERVKERENA